MTAPASPSRLFHRGEGSRTVRPATEQEARDDQCEPYKPSPASLETEVPASQPAYAQGPSEIALRGETIGRMWHEVVAEHGARPAIVSRHQGIRWTYAELDAQVERCARALLAAGVEMGDRVGIWSPNNAEWVVVQFATARIGAILVNINPSYRAHELEYALRQSGCSLLILAPRFKDADYRELLGSVDAPALRRAVVLGDEWDELLEEAGLAGDDAVASRQAECDFDDPINIQYTSGTTGFPKGATLSHHNILNNGFFIGEYLRYTPEDRVCIPVPFYHCFGMVLGNLAVVTHGACIVVPSEAFDPRAVLETVADERCTSLYGVPTMFIAELADPDFPSFDLTSLRTGIMAGSPCPIEVMKRVQGEDAHERGHDLLRHDGDLARLDPDPRRRPAREAGLHRREGASARRGEDRRPRRQGGRRRVARPASSVRVATASCSATGRTTRRPARPSTRRAGCTPATWR